MRRALWAMSLAVVIGCVAPVESIDPSTPVITPRPSQPRPMETSAPTATLEPTPVALHWEDLAPLRSAPADVTAICDPLPGVEFPDPGAWLIQCGQGVHVGLQVIETVTDERPIRAYLQLPRCEAAPCSPEQLSTGSVTVWTKTDAWITHLDGQARTATLPILNASTDWPTLDALVPSVDRPLLPMAPAELVEREPYPWCGHVEFEEPPGDRQCFVAAVLGGRAAEVSATVYGVEGGEGTHVYRYSGSGAISFYSRHIDSVGSVGGWYTQRVWLTLGVEAHGPMYWSIEGIDDTYRELP